MDEHIIYPQAEDIGKRIDVFISQKVEGITRSYAQKLIDENRVTVNHNNNYVKSNYKLRAKDWVNVVVPDPQVLKIEADSSIILKVLYEDNDLIVIDKPQGMVVHPAAGNYEGTLVNAVMAHCKDNLSQINGVIRPGIVHRIDKDTSGVLVIAKNDKAHLSLAKQIKEHTVTRRYISIVVGNIKEDEGTINAPIGRHPIDRKKMAVTAKGRTRSAVTHFKVLERFEDYTLIEAQLETGRTHQIRVHMAYINHPVLGDPVYGPKKSSFKLKGQVLHARILGFIHPTKNEYMEFQSEIPEYFNQIINTLRGKNKC